MSTKKDNLTIKIEAVSEYINYLNHCEDNNLDVGLAYSMVINQFRQEAGLKPTGGKLNPRLKRFMEKHNLKIPECFQNEDDFDDTSIPYRVIAKGSTFGR